MSTQVKSFAECQRNGEIHKMLLAETTHGMQPCSGSEKHKKRAKKDVSIHIH